LIGIRFLRRLLYPTFNQKLGVNGAGGIAPEAIIERLIEAVEIESFRAPRISAVEKRAMLTLVRHNNSAI
jgi:hypothetical protein